MEDEVHKKTINFNQEQVFQKPTKVSFSKFPPKALITAGILTASPLAAQGNGANSAGSSLVDMFKQGGAIMAILLGYSIMAVSILINRIITIGRFKEKNYDEFINSIQHLDTPKAIEYCQQKTSVLAEVALFALKNRNNSRPILASKLENRYASKIRPKLTEMKLLGRKVSYQAKLGFMITTAPLFGLLGTVSGLIDTTGALNLVTKIAEVFSVSQGISEALVTTGAGLIVSLIAIFINFAITNIYLKQIDDQILNEFIEDIRDDNSFLPEHFQPWGESI